MEKKVIIFKGYWNRNDVRNNLKHLFIYGDNDISKGVGGQAIIRYEPNTIGISTKKQPNYLSTSYYTDVEYDINRMKIDCAIINIIGKFIKGNYTSIVLPVDGLGTGLANLPKHAPKTYTYLNNSIKELMEYFEQNSSSLWPY